MPANKPGITVREFLAAAVGIVVLPSSFIGGQTASQGSSDRESSDPISDTARLEIGAATIEITFGPGGFDLPRESIVAWISKAAHAVAQYYGVFPVPLSRVRVNSSERQSGVFGGETWGSAPPFTHIFVGRNTSLQQLDRDWVMTHELIHTAFPNVADEHHWIEEGIATYVEPIARAQIGDLTAQKIWSDMFRDMPKGEPQAFDEGLDRTHTWGRTYWGGALFCLVADLRIRQVSGNRKGLQDALRGIRDAGGTIDRHWPVERAFEVGDRASRTNVLATLYSEMKDKPVYIDLSKIWRELGVASSEGVVSLSDAAPLARIRRSITSP
ncbi:MAG TPA: hypothetical protein VG168_05370 [Bryobacteraceae bacterium]|nr:hypothetical protein [Bryobacteraceae bacterium]